MLSVDLFELSLQTPRYVPAGHRKFAGTTDAWPVQEI